MQSTLVLVEAPTKAKTISKYLPDCTVIATYGHLRDLPSQNGSVDPANDFSMVWGSDERGKKTIAEIIKAVKGIKTLVLATDPDREGEAIAWHVLQILSEKKLLKNVDVKRIVFHEITKSAVQHAFDHPRVINQDLVDAYLTRRALDYLVGFTLSPVLWRKLPGARSAGRVQSVALRLIVEREHEILEFKTQEYWSIEGTFKTDTKQKLIARLTQLHGKKLEKFSIHSAADGTAIVNFLKDLSYTVLNVDKKQVKRQPSPPFITSTLQQEASRKLGFSAHKTMKIAQSLYEGIEINGELTGLITYMRTDSLNLSNEALSDIRRVLKKDYSADYVPKDVREFKNKVKNAQEAHEAIRPTQIALKPQDVEKALSGDHLKLYTLIWKRTLASQMANALFDQVSVDIEAQNNIFHASGSVLVFDGFLKLYQEGNDDDQEEASKKLPALEPGETVKLHEIDKNQHFTQPPPRYTEASLIKKMEELGIGRPSTYVSLIQVLQDRSYVSIEKKQFVPAGIGHLLIFFLLYLFEKYIRYDFTAEMEESLDSISSGGILWKDVLKQFWDDFSKIVESTSDLRINHVIEHLENTLSSYLFPNGRECPTCHEGTLSLRLGKFGAFLGCSLYPQCRYINPLFKEEIVRVDQSIGKDPVSNQEIFLKNGPYGLYFEWEPIVEPKKKKPTIKRVRLPNGLSIDQANLSLAIELKNIPRTLGIHPQTSEPIEIGIGPFGPYIKYLEKFISIPKSIVEFWKIDINNALSLIQAKEERMKNKSKK